MKRKADASDGSTTLANGGQPESKKQALSGEEATSRFHKGLFEPSMLQKYTKEYARSAPYVLFEPI